jgi:hypothetical protein
MKRHCIVIGLLDEHRKFMRKGEQDLGKERLGNMEIVSLNKGVI